MHPYVAHLKNKYPGSVVQASEHAIDVFNKEGEHLLSLQRSGGSGQFEDVSHLLGLPEKFCLAPIPKESRVFKFSKDGKLVKDEKAADREKSRGLFIKEGKVLSQDELVKNHGFRFDRDGYVAEAGKIDGGDASVSVDASTVAKKPAK